MYDYDYDYDQMFLSHMHLQCILQLCMAPECLISRQSIAMTIARKDIPTDLICLCGKTKGICPPSRIFSFLSVPSMWREERHLPKIARPWTNPVTQGFH